MSDELERMDLVIGGDASEVEQSSNAAVRALQGLEQRVNSITARIRQKMGRASAAASAGISKSTEAQRLKIENMTRKLDAVNYEIETQQKKLAVLQEKYAAAASIKTSPKSAEAAARLQEQIAKVESRIASLIEKSDKAAASIIKLEDAMNAAATSGEGGAGADGEKAAAAQRGISGRFREISDSAKKAGQSVREQMRRMAKSTGPVHRGLNLVTASIRRILVSLVLFRTFREAAQYIGRATTANKEFAASLAQIKGNLLTAFAPILNALMPILNQFAQTLARVTGYVATFIAVLFGQTYRQAQQSAKAINDAANASENQADAIKKAAKAARGAVASFDELNDITKEQASTASTGSPNTGIAPDFNQSIQPPAWIQTAVGWIEKLKTAAQPAVESLRLLWAALEPVKDFVWVNIQNFYEYALKPIGLWVLGTGLPAFLDTTRNLVESIDWEGLANSNKRFWQSLTPFATKIGEGLLWFYEQVIVPIIAWAANNIIPPAIDSVSYAFDILNEVIDAAKPVFSWLWEKFIQPIGKWTGDVIKKALEALRDKLQGLSNWINENQSKVESITAAVLAFFAAWTIAKLVSDIPRMISSINSVISVLGTLNWKMLAISAAIAGITYAVIEVAKAWPKMTPPQKFWTVVSAIVAAIGLLAATFAILHGSITGGLIGAGFAIAGIASVLAIANKAAEDQKRAAERFAISGYATGGFPDVGEIYMARENGKNEFIGRIGNRPAVANNDQIVESVKQGVYEATVAALSDANQGGSSGEWIEAVKMTIYEQAFGQIVVRALRNEERRTGNRYLQPEGA